MTFASEIRDRDVRCTYGGMLRHYTDDMRAYGWKRRVRDGRGLTKNVRMKRLQPLRKERKDD